MLKYSSLFTVANKTIIDYKAFTITSSIVVLATGMWLAVGSVAFAEAQRPSPNTKLLDPNRLCKYENDLPIPPTINARVKPQNKYVMSIQAGKADMGLRSNFKGNCVKTFPDAKVWGFVWENPDPSYTGGRKVLSPGPTFLVKEGTPISVFWKNKLFGPHLFPVDTTIHTPVRDGVMLNERPIVIHLHGGHTEPASDGHPEAWFTPRFKKTGGEFRKKLYNYSNTQDATALWYHSHTIGLTRLDNYAGTAGFYLVTDDHERRLIADNKLPTDDRTVPIVVQDKLFTSEGQLYYPGRHGAPLSPLDERGGIPAEWPDPTVLDEFFGNVIVVNGKVWPKHEVDPKVYRLRLLNAADTRTFIFKFVTQSGDELPFFVIGSDGGLLAKPAKVKQLVMSPAERYDVLVNFARYENKQIFLHNVGADEPFRGYFNPDRRPQPTKLVYKPNDNWVLVDGSDPDHPGRFREAPPTEVAKEIMRFDVGPTSKEPNDESPRPCEPHCLGDLNLTPNTPLIKRMSLPDVDVNRQLGLFKRDDNEGNTPERGRNLLLLGTVKEGSLFFDDPLTENIKEGSTEIWELYNTTVAGHPIHIHLVEFEILNRQRIEFVPEDKFQDDPNNPGGKPIKGVKITKLKLKDKTINPQPNEQGRKDTVISLPGYVTRVKAHFDCTGIDCTTGKYVWHCHLLSHEDYDMMRPFKMEKLHEAQHDYTGTRNVVAGNQPANFSAAGAMLGQHDVINGSFVSDSVLCEIGEG